MVLRYRLEISGRRRGAAGNNKGSGGLERWIVGEVHFRKRLFSFVAAAGHKHDRIRMRDRGRLRMKLGKKWTKKKYSDVSTTVPLESSADEAKSQGLGGIM